MQPKGSLSDQIIRLMDSGRLKLPVFNPVALKMQELIARKIEDIGIIEHLILSDQALAAEVLRAANSPFYCGLSPVKTIRNAIVRMGIQQMRRLVMLVSERANYRARHAVLHSLLQDLWQHASSTALSAQWLSKRLHMTGIEEICFLGGLLHDIGKLAILRAVDDIQKESPGKLDLSPTAIEDLLAKGHCVIGYNLLKKFNIPDIYCQIARDHHSEKIDEGDLTLAIARLANIISRNLDRELNTEEVERIAGLPEARMLDMTAVVLSELNELLKDHMDNVA